MYSHYNTLNWNVKSFNPLQLGSTSVLLKILHMHDCVWWQVCIPMLACMWVYICLHIYVCEYACMPACVCVCVLHRPGFGNCTGACKVTSCKACYYNEEPRNIPSGCQHQCDGLTERPLRKCLREWGRCIRKQYKKLYGRDQVREIIQIAYNIRTYSIILYIFYSCRLFKHVKNIIITIIMCQISDSFLVSDRYQNTHT